MKALPKNTTRDPMIVDKSHLELLLMNVLTLPRHSGRNSSLVDSVGQYIMRKFGRMGLLTGTQVFVPSKFRDQVWKKTIFCLTL